MNKLILSIAALLLTITASAQQVSTHVYKEKNGVKQELDIYLPSGDAQGTKKPVLILFHGGGLISGNKESMKAISTYFAGKGLVVVSANYTLLAKGAGGKNRLPLVEQCIKDAKSAVRWVKAHAADYNIDLNRVLLGGGSAGGLLATECALNEDINEDTDDKSINTKGIAQILYNPAYIPVTSYGPAVNQYVSRQTPPAIMFFGSEDKFKAGGASFYSLLDKAGVKTELWVASGESHSFFNKPRWNTATNYKAWNFMLNLGLVKGAPEQDVTDSPLTLQKPN